jgi:hypothetical protein
MGPKRRWQDPSPEQKMATLAGLAGFEKYYMRVRVQRELPAAYEFTPEEVGQHNTLALYTDEEFKEWLSLRPEGKRKAIGKRGKAAHQACVKAFGSEPPVDRQKSCRTIITLNFYC